MIHGILTNLRAIELDDTQKEFYYDLGIAQVEFEDYDDGIANLTRAIELAGDEPYTQALIGRNAAFIRASKLAENRGRARELLDVGPQPVAVDPGSLGLDELQRETLAVLE